MQHQIDITNPHGTGIPTDLCQCLITVLGTVVIVIFAFGIVSTIITYNKTKNSSDDKSSTPLPNILVKETRKVDNRSRKSRAIPTKEELQLKCKQKADKLLANFTNELLLNDRYKKLYAAVRQLRHLFVSRYFFSFFFYLI